jgi:hypothetical protein
VLEQHKLDVPVVTAKIINAHDIITPWLDFFRIRPAIINDKR